MNKILNALHANTVLNKRNNITDGKRTQNTGMSLAEVHGILRDILEKFQIDYGFDYYDADFITLNVPECNVFGLVVKGSEIELWKNVVDDHKASVSFYTTSDLYRNNTLFDEIIKCCNERGKYGYVLVIQDDKGEYRFISAEEERNL